MKNAFRTIPITPLITELLKVMINSAEVDRIKNL